MLAHRCLLGFGLLRGHRCGGQDGGSSFAIPAPVILQGRFQLCEAPASLRRSEVWPSSTLLAQAGPATARRSLSPLPERSIGKQ